MELPIARGSHSLFLDSCAAHEGQGTCGTPGIAVRSRNVPASLINDPEHWRDRAREKRELADRLRNERASKLISARGPIVNIIFVLPRIHVAPNALIVRVVTRRPLRRACDIDIITSMPMRPSAYVLHFLCRGCLVSNAVVSLHLSVPE